MTVYKSNTDFLLPIIYVKSR